MTATHVNHQGTGRRRAIGPLGTTARVLVGGLLVGSVTWGHLTRGFHLSAWLLGLVGFPALLVAGQWLRTRRTPTPCGPPARSPTRSTWPCSWRCTCWSRPATPPCCAMGASMGLAAARGYAGCEVLAVSNRLLRRDDQVGCAVFWPVDQLEHHRTVRGAA